MQQTVKAFQLGRSIVVTLPKQLGVKVGERLTVNKKGKKIILGPQQMTDKEIEKLVDKLSGGLNLKKHLTPEEINDLLDKEYEDHKIVLPRR